MKESGFGRENGWETFHQYTQTQSIVVNYGTAKSDWFGQAAARYN
jgi:acyl-CoA reductase-like NAD-dependent aldehyde dehydrogenase